MKFAQLQTDRVTFQLQLDLWVAGGGLVNVLFIQTTPTHRLMLFNQITPTDCFILHVSSVRPQPVNLEYFALYLLLLWRSKAQLTGLPGIQ